MDIIRYKESPTFDGDIVKQSGFIQARYRTWPCARNGLVSCVTRDRLTCLFPKGTGAAVAYFVIRANEVADGNWEITYRNDLGE